MREIRVQLLQKVFSFCGTLSPRSPIGAPPLDPAGGLVKASFCRVYVLIYFIRSPVL